ncbi:MAG: hemolysin family protein [Desulfobulbus sp.]
MDFLLLLLLILLNAVFAMSEIAVLSSREARLQKMAAERFRGANSALKLKNNPAAFLSTVQIGITMVGILSGAVGENALVEPLTRWLGNLRILQSSAQPLAMGLVVIGLTYVTVVIGELVPKHLGLLTPERIASLVARPMRILARIAKPLVWLLTASSNRLLRLIGARSQREAGVSDEEIRLLMEQGAKAGVFHESEQVLVANVLRLDELPVEAIMTHRQDVQLLDLDLPEAEIRAFLAVYPHSRIIACRDGWNVIAGLLRTADLLKAALAGVPLTIEEHLRPPSYVPEHVTTTQLLEHFRKAQLQCALVVDEYGDIQGLVTLTDVLTAIVGEVPSSSLADLHTIRQREDGSWLIDGSVPIDRVKYTLGLKNDLTGEADHQYHAIAGFVIHVLGRIPTESDHFEEQGHRFEVVDMDHHRIDKVLVTPLCEAVNPSESIGGVES